jgi:hypothetical protein
MKRKWGSIFAVFFIVLFFMIALIAVADLMVAELMIGPAVRSFSQTAQAQFHGKRIEALTAMVDCESCSLRDRNYAVWTLGQLDDPRALPVLEKYYAGAKGYQPNNLSQDRLRIALRHLRHEDYNRFESVLWRWMLPVEN